jgi:hypothetical protein
MYAARISSSISTAALRSLSFSTSLSIPRLLLHRHPRLDHDLVALGKPHREVEPSPATLTTVDGLERAQRRAAELPRTRPVLAAAYLILGRAGGQQRRHVVDNPPVPDRDESLLKEDALDRRPCRVDRRPREHVLLARVGDSGEPFASLRPAQPHAHLGLATLVQPHPPATVHEVARHPQRIRRLASHTDNARLADVDALGAAHTVLAHERHP